MASADQPLLLERPARNGLVCRLIGMDIAIAALMAKRGPGETALELLDRICEPHRGAQVDFKVQVDELDDDELEANDGALLREQSNVTHYNAPHPEAPLGLLLVEAFAPKGLDSMPSYAAGVDPNADEGEGNYAIALWEYEVESKFKSRYSFS